MTGFDYFFKVGPWDTFVASTKITAPFVEILGWET